MTTAPAPRSVDVELGHGRTLRATLVLDDVAAGGPVVILAVGFGGGASERAFHRPAWVVGDVLRLPATSIPELVRALEQLAVMTAAEHLEAAQAHLAGARRALVAATAELGDLERHACSELVADVDEVLRRLANVTKFTRRSTK